SVLKTEDGGLTWTQQGVVQPPASIHWIRCADALRCVAVTARGDQLLRTEDGGSTWTSISPSTLPLLAATYSAAGSMVAVGEAGATVASADGGHNFATVGDDLPGRFTHVRATSAATAYAWGRAGALARSTDGGETWFALAAPGPASLVDVTFPTAARGYALDADGGLMLTDDGGDSWHLLDIGTYLKPRAVIAPDASRVLLIGPRGMRRSRSGGFGFKRVRQDVVAKLRLNAGGTTTGLAFAYGPRALVVSEDAGENWHAATIPRQGKALVKVDFVSDTVAYALTRNGRVWKTIDRARDWQELPATGTEKATDLAFSDPKNGYVAVSQFGEEPNGYVMRTSDGGSTWRPQLVDRTRIRPGALEAPGPLAGFAISDVDHLLATETGGDVGEPSQIGLSVRRRRPGQAGVVAVSGQLTPAHGGEKVWVSRREKDKHWVLRDVRVSSTGRFTIFSDVTRPTQFVAQWSGDDTRAGAGSPALTIRVRQKAPGAKR
ncbi:MAG TPA: hypothetical protein VH300_01850, partial [Thermoleophilaceae bacterium]|nr:hypothetical protein [Thermoleophilaceae bacterium]